MGSPPRGRGKGFLSVFCNNHLGITPAWAGKSADVPKLGACEKDHPRVGGEKTALCLVLAAVMGSPPRGRGKEGGSSFGLVLRRITPAWAGKSSRAEVSGRGQEDHPRVGGEKNLPITRRRLFQGSPPRGRGKGLDRPLPDFRHGITPAWAGKSLKALIRMVCPWDHPRVGGEKTLQTS